MGNGQILTLHDTRLSGISAAGISRQCAQGSTHCLVAVPNVHADAIIRHVS